MYPRAQSYRYLKAQRDAHPRRRLIADFFSILEIQFFHFHFSLNLKKNRLTDLKGRNRYKNIIREKKIRFPVSFDLSPCSSKMRAVTYIVLFMLQVIFHFFYFARISFGIKFPHLSLLLRTLISKYHYIVTNRR